jgi:glycosyltransferase involved in cell wall biosynthesis
VKEASPETLAAAIERLADDEPLRRRMGVSARERVVERYSWDKHCTQLDDLLRRLVMGQPR